MLRGHHNYPACVKIEAAVEANEKAKVADLASGKKKHRKKRSIHRNKEAAQIELSSFLQRDTQTQHLLLRITR